MTKPHTADAHYWAKQIASDYPDTGELYGQWEVVQTLDNGGVGKFDLRVLVPGQEKSESLDNFEWGPRVIRPASLSND